MADSEFDYAPFIPEYSLGTVENNEAGTLTQCQAKECTPVMPQFRRQGQEDYKVEASLRYTGWLQKLKQ